MAVVFSEVCPMAALMTGRAIPCVLAAVAQLCRAV